MARAAGKAFILVFSFFCFSGTLAAEDVCTQDDTMGRAGATFDGARLIAPAPSNPRPTHPAFNFALNNVAPFLAVTLGSSASAYRESRERDSLWSTFRPGISITPDGFMVTLAGGGATTLPSSLVSDPAQVARLQQDYPASGYYNAAIMGVTAALTGALLEQAGIIRTPEPWYSDLGLNFGTGYVLGSVLNQGAFHRDVALGGLNALLSWTLNATIDWIAKRPIRDPRYDVVSYGAVYGIRSLIPERGNPMLSDGRTGSEQALNAITDVAFEAIWDGGAGYLADVLRGNYDSLYFLRHMVYGVVARTLVNALYGTRVRLEPQVMERAREIALTRGGIDIGPVERDFELRRGGITDLEGLSGVSRFNWVSIENLTLRSPLLEGGVLTPAGESVAGLLAHEYAHAWAVDRIGLQFGIWYLWRFLAGEDYNHHRYETLPYLID
ncbi:MAG: hypothetical protein HYT79_07030 [Elusimicrobia bacterium]|nr:hypothetical protein [Elusimicrobiota bacterium]